MFALPRNRDDTARSHLRQRVTFAALVAVLLAFQFARAMNRHSDPDEFQFVAPPALLTEFGKLPYVDYPYFHTPNLIFVQAVTTGWTPHKLMAARTLSAACGTATIALLFSVGWRLLSEMPPRSRWILCGGTSLIFATSRLFTFTSGNAWNHDTAVLCVLGACLLHLRGMRTGRWKPVAFAGFLAGFAVGIRLNFAFVVIPFSVSLLFGPTTMQRRQRWAALGAAGTAAAVANLPSIWLAALAPGRFAFGTVGYAALSTEYYRTLPGQSAMTFFGKIGSSLSKFVTDPCNLIILAGFSFAAFGFLFGHPPRDAAARSRRSELGFIIGLAASLWAGAMGPTPMMQQYNYMFLPFMVLAILYYFAMVSPDAVRAGKIVRSVAVLTVLFGVTGLFRWYWSVIYLASPGHWQPNVQHREAIWIQSMTRPGARVLTIESEIPLEAGLEIYPEFAVGRFVLLVEKFAAPSDRVRNNLVGPGELPVLLSQRPPDAVLVRNDHGCDRPFLDYAVAHHFRPVPDPDGISTLWVSPKIPQ